MPPVRILSSILNRKIGKNRIADVDTNRQIPVCENEAMRTGHRKSEMLAANAEKSIAEEDLGWGQTGNPDEMYTGDSRLFVQR